MRHTVGFVLAIVLALAIFFGAGWGYLRLLRVPVQGGGVATLPAGGGSLLHDKNVLLAFAALAAVGLLAAILLAAPRISPLAAGLPGAVLLLWTLFYLSDVHRAVQYIPMKGKAFGAGFEAMLINGVLGAAGLALIVPLFIPSRWWHEEPSDVEEGRLAPATPAGRSGMLLSDWGSETAPIPPPGQQPPPSPPW